MTMQDKDLVPEVLAVHTESSEDDALYERWEEVEDSGWASECKYEHRSIVYKHTPTGRLFCVADSRSGSYFTDYHYDDPQAYEVRAELVQTTNYVPIA